MSAATTPIFTDAVRHAVAQVTTANAALDGTGTPVTIFTAGADGSCISKVTAKAIVTTTTGMIRLFVHNGTTAFLIAELTVDAITPSATVAAWTEDWTPPGGALYLPTGYSLRATTEKTETFNIHAIGGDF